jgi:hypothetical protein
MSRHTHTHISAVNYIYMAKILSLYALHLTLHLALGRISTSSEYRWVVDIISYTSKLFELATMSVVTG